MLHDKRLAIVTSQALVNLGLKSLLREYFSPQEIHIFSDVQALLNGAPDRYDFYLVSPELFLVHCDFFLPRKNKTILLTQYKHSTDTLQNATYQLCVNGDISQLTEQLENIFTTACQQSDNEIHEELSPREIEVLQLVVQGYINKEIAEKLNISFNTVLTHRKNITAKLGIKTVSGLSFYAMMNGYITAGNL